MARWKGECKRKALEADWVRVRQITSLKTCPLSTNLIASNNRRLRAHSMGIKRKFKSPLWLWGLGRIGLRAREGKRPQGRHTDQRGGERERQKEHIQKALEHYSCKENILKNVLYIMDILPLSISVKHKRWYFEKWLSVLFWKSVVSKSVWLPTFFKISSFCVLQRKESHTGLEWHSHFGVISLWVHILTNTTKLSLVHIQLDNQFNQMYFLFIMLIIDNRYFITT